MLKGKQANSNTHAGQNAKIVRLLLDKLGECPCSPELNGRKILLSSAIEKLPEYAKLLAEGYSRALEGAGISHGEVRIYAVGGILKGEKVDLRSDIDLVIAVENPAGAPSFFMSNQPVSSVSEAGKTTCYLWHNNTSSLQEKEARAAMDAFRPVFENANLAFSIPAVIDIVNSNQPLDNRGRQPALLVYSTKGQLPD